MKSNKATGSAQLLHSQIITLVESIERTTVNLILALEKIDSLKTKTSNVASAAFFNTDERIRLTLLNRRLAEVEQMTQQVLDVRERQAQAAYANPKNRLHDVSVDATATLHLRDDDPAYSIQSDNVIATRGMVHIPRAERDAYYETDFAEDDSYAAKVVERPHCFLFYDFIGLEYADCPKLTLEECLRVGGVMVDVKVTYQYWMDIETGSWEPLGRVTSKTDF